MQPLLGGAHKCCFAGKLMRDAAGRQRLRMSAPVAMAVPHRGLSAFPVSATTMASCRGLPVIKATPMEPAVPEPSLKIVELPILELTAERFAPYGSVIAPMEDDVPSGVADAPLDLSAGRPRFYAMRIPARGLTVTHITRHRRVTQMLASVGGQTWFLAVAPPLAVDDPKAEPALDDISAFRIPGNVGVMLHKGSWHAGPLFEAGEQSFFNLELADTNVVDHHTSDLVARYGCALRLRA
jgi:ureidoglycolate lyase